MKKLLSVSMVIGLVLALALTSCGGGKETKPAQTQPQVELNAPKIQVTRNSTGPGGNLGPVPDWVANVGTAYVGASPDGKGKYIYFVFEGEAKNKETARAVAEANAKGALADSIKNSTLKQLSTYMEGSTEDTQLQKYVEELIATVAKATFSGVIPAGAYWEEFYKVWPDGRTEGPIYRFVVKYGLDYNTWLQQVQAAWNNMKGRTQIPQDVKEKMEKAINQLSSEM